VDQKNFVAPQWGRAVSTGGSYPFVTFVPARLPRTLDLDLATVRALSAADTALGRLAGAGRLLPNPHLLIVPYRVQEAVASSRIEGTQARNRLAAAVERTVPFGLACQTLAVCWYATAGHHPDDVTAHRTRARGTGRRPTRPQRTCSPSSAASSPPLDFGALGPTS